MSDILDDERHIYGVVFFHMQNVRFFRDAFSVLFFISKVGQKNNLTNDKWVVSHYHCIGKYCLLEFSLSLVFFLHFLLFWL